MSMEKRKQELADLVKSVHKTSREIYEKHKNLTAVVIGQTESGERLVLPLPFENENEQNTLAALVARALREHGVLAYAMSMHAIRHNVPEPPEGQTRKEYSDYLIKTGEYKNLPQEEILFTIGEDMWGNQACVTTTVKDKTLGDDVFDDTKNEFKHGPFHDVFE